MKEEEIRKRAVFSEYLALVESDLEVYFDPRQFEAIACPACAGASFSDTIVKMGFRCLVCSDCATIYASPRPPFSQLKAFYEESPSTSYWVKEFFLPVADVRREKIFRPRAEFVSRMMPEQGVDRLVIGDVGTGFGLFLEEIRRLKPDHHYVGIEPSTEMRTRLSAAGFEVAPTCLEDVRGMDGRFNLLTSFELLDHLSNPRAFLEQALDLLKPGGILFLSAVNGLGFDILTLWEKSNMIIPPIHLTLFNPSSVRQLLTAVGFEIVDISTPGRLDWDIVDNSIRTEGFEAGRFWNWLSRNGSEKAKSELQRWFSDNQLSSHMWVVARRPI